MSSDSVTDAVDRCLETLPKDTRLMVAFSGGVDSHVLLHALAQANAARGGRALFAIHVNHGLHPDAGAWALHCEQVCRALGVPLEVVAVQVSKKPKQGPEAAARDARYAAFERRLKAGDVLLLAHHLDDQAETFLLQLLRGAGPAGLSAMPVQATLGSGRLLRPLLEVSREDVHAYAKSFSLEFIDDPSNAEMRYDRNYLRHEIIPRLAKRWPGVSRTIARAAGHQAALARMARELGAEALNAAEDGVTLSCKALSRMSPDSARLALRAWLEGRGFSPPSKVMLERILQEVVAAAADAEPLVTWSGVEVRRYQGALYVMGRVPRAEPDWVMAWDGRAAVALPQGRLSALPATGRGITASLCRPGHLELRFRRGGERCRPQGQDRSSTLKAWFQRRGVPPWERDRIPLIFIDGELAAVADRWVCEGFQCAAGEKGVLLEWAPAPGT
ncbi:MAG: tRNA lysidine(34) synthetase TilS [Gammaproteobacteria bacterium]|nr:tRNA lysidine(34) synthetase TilS [Gammaproteobacteria bacterium]